MSCRAGCYVFKCWLDHKPAGWPAINTLSQLKWSLTVYAIVSLFCSSSNISTRIPRMVKSLVSFLLFWKGRGSSLSWTFSLPRWAGGCSTTSENWILILTTMSYVISVEFLLIKHLARKICGLSPHAWMIFAWVKNLLFTRAWSFCSCGELLAC